MLTYIVVEITSLLAPPHRQVCDQRLFVGNSRPVNVSGEKFHRRRDKYCRWSLLTLS
jgi:hypothetical protein